VDVAGLKRWAQVAFRLDRWPLGLHPHVLPSLAKLLRDASAQAQLIVTTHSDVLVDGLTDYPEAVVVTESHDGCTAFKRLEAPELRLWLEKYTLGTLRTRGESGDTRW